MYEQSSRAALIIHNGMVKLSLTDLRSYLGQDSALELAWPGQRGTHLYDAWGAPRAKNSVFHPAGNDVGRCASTAYPHAQKTAYSILREAH
jgi:hypothetical protein